MTKGTTTTHHETKQLHFLNCVTHLSQENIIICINSELPVIFDEANIKLQTARNSAQHARVRVCSKKIKNVHDATESQLSVVIFALSELRNRQAASVKRQGHSEHKPMQALQEANAKDIVTVSIAFPPPRCVHTGRGAFFVVSLLETRSQILTRVQT